ncbi:hypothetical protein ACP70R_015507 [Stipagrostis hirtigluma subsp. patula]
MGAVRVELEIILPLCLLLMAFLQGPVLAADGNGPTTCEHVPCDKQEVIVSWKEKENQESHKLIHTKLNRSLRIMAMSTAVRRRLPGCNLTYDQSAKDFFALSFILLLCFLLFCCSVHPPHKSARDKRPKRENEVNPPQGD